MTETKALISALVTLYRYSTSFVEFQELLAARRAPETFSTELLKELSDEAHESLINFIIHAGSLLSPDCIMDRDIIYATPLNDDAAPEACIYLTLLYRFRDLPPMYTESLVLAFCFKPSVEGNIACAIKVM